MKIKAISTIIAFDGQMVVINAGETGELRDDLAQQEIDAGKAVAVKSKGKAAAEDAADASGTESAADQAPE